MRQSGTQIYLKVGTTGTGGMGLNIPYTHSESKPSRTLMSKSAVAGASSLLYLLMNRTAGGPVIKEIKPAALIGWKGVGFGEIKKHGKPIALYDCALADGVPLDSRRGRQRRRGAGSNPGVHRHRREWRVQHAESRRSPARADGQTSEDVARAVVEEIRGESTGRHRRSLSACQD
jgi:hypothetical protein